MANDLHLKTDFHALKVLLHVHDLGSITAAADQLGMSQSSVSYTIDRLREVFGDPLFVRLGRAIAPTVRCEAAAAGARQLLGQYEDLVTPVAFDPATSTETFVLSCNFLERSILLAPLVRHLQRAAPRARLHVISAEGEGMEQLRSAACDVVVSPVAADTAGLYSERLLSEKYACFISHHSRWTTERLDLESYIRAEHIEVRPAPNWRPYFHTALDRLGMTTTPRVVVSSFGEIDRAIDGTDLILTASEGFKRSFSPRITCVRAPFDCTFSIHMAWAGRTHRSGAHLWFRQVLRDIMAVESQRPHGDEDGISV
ncbi:LysR family transcriptional regulator [Jiella pelagia]|uniref:LysR family transcriptional regulator n=1 Tax=Jiella pelagia TaxID=2986949 RepID=A0ABY7C3K1_9HYPH|nr:LysR family transcriptional regulator [Jiella pelagia]WAP69801.1 LysR family transcriptional regulator [Jiella pelagia]